MELHQQQLPLFAEAFPNENDLLYRESLRLAESIRAPRTLRGYLSDWKTFCLWCAKQGREALPATTDTVKLYITDSLLNGRRVTTLRHHVCAIIHHHRLVGCEGPARREILPILTGAQRIRGEQARAKAAITVEQLRMMLWSLDRPEPSRTRDQAVLLFGFSTALRRSNIAMVEIADLDFRPQGFVVHVRKEKQDQTGIGRTIGVPFGKHADTCPVQALQAWLTYRGITPGPVFCGMRASKIEHERPIHTNTLAAIVKRGAEAIGLDTADYAAHSLRAGFITSALEGGVGEIVTARHSGHRSLGTLKRYMRSEDPFRANACTALEL
jgi:integrase